VAESPVFSIPDRGTFDPAFAFEEPGRTSVAGLGPPRRPEPQATLPDPVGFDPLTKQVYVNGSIFHADDHQSAIESPEYLKRPITEMPGNFQPVSPEMYRGYLDRIANPSLGRIIKKNIGIGVDVSQMLAGSALKFVGAEETGQAIVDQQTEDLRFNQPYQRTFTEDALGSPGGAGEWFVANAAQLAPLMIEMMLASFVGGFAGGGVALAGGVRGATKGIGLLTKAGRKRTAVLARQAMRKQAKGEVLERGSAHHTALRTVGRANGARMGALAASYGVAVGDIYQEISEAGNYDNAIQARLATALFAVPYAYAELAPAQLALTQAFKAAGKGFKTGGRLKRGTKGLVVGGGIEGGTEGFQEVLALGASGELDFSDSEVQNRLINAVAAGVGVGAPLGGLANVIGRTAQPEPDKPGPTDLLQIEPPLKQITDNSTRQVPGPGPTDLLTDESAPGLAQIEATGGPPFGVIPVQSGQPIQHVRPEPAVEVAPTGPEQVGPVLDLREDQIIDPSQTINVDPGGFVGLEGVRDPQSIDVAPTGAEQIIPVPTAFAEQALGVADVENAIQGLEAAAQAESNAIQEAQFAEAEAAEEQQALDELDLIDAEADTRLQEQLPLPAAPPTPVDVEVTPPVRDFTDRQRRRGLGTDPMQFARTGEPKINVPGKEGKVRTVTVRQVMEGANQEVESLEALMACQASRFK